MSTLTVLNAELIVCFSGGQPCEAIIYSGITFYLGIDRAVRATVYNGDEWLRS